MMSDLPLFEQILSHVRSSDSFVDGKDARAVHYTFRNISQVPVILATATATPQTKNSRFSHDVTATMLVP